MKRRDFLRATAPLGIAPLLASGLPVNAVSATSPLWFNPCSPTDRCLVVIYLNGGNDIFNTTIPLSQFSDYANFRPNVYLAQNQLITLDNTLPTNQQIGLHPNLTGFKSLYDAGLLNIIQGVGHPHSNRSHFKALDNWLTSSGEAEQYSEGWVGRFLRDRYPTYTGLPFTGESDPLGMLFSGMYGGGFHTHEEHSYEIGMSGQDTQGFYSVISTIAGDPLTNIPSTDYGSKLTHLENIATTLNVYSQRVNATFNSGTNSGNVTYPSSELGNQMKTIVKMLSGGSRTKVFMATTGGFDTHAGQVDSANTLNGFHSVLLQDLSDSVKAFQDDLIHQGLDDKVMTVIFSEFGRKVVENGSYGTDHGTLSSVFVIGKGVQGGVIGTNIDLQQQDDRGAPDNGQLQYDYRRIYGTLLQDWLGANDSSVNNIFEYNTGTSYTQQKLSFINNSNIVTSACYYTPVAQTGCACFQVKVFLEGLYDAGLSEMKTTLSAAASFPMNQPYNVAPFNYSGSENLTTIPTDTVDWLLIELREQGNLMNVIARQAVLLRKDGFIMQLDGTAGIAFSGITVGNYHLAIFHRNHLGIVSSSTIELDNSTYVYDFSQAAWRAYGVNQQKAIGSVFVMYAGDINNDYRISNQDYNLYTNNTGSNVGYSQFDLNGDAQVDNLDETLWTNNRSKIGALEN